DMHHGSDHSTLVATIPGCKQAPLEQCYFRVQENVLPKFAGLDELGKVHAPQAKQYHVTAQLEDCIKALIGVIDSAIKAAGKPDRGTRHAT
ncbi:hypothetical protein CC80DRAFT_355933, partial [Byssothecium circinans]